MANAKPLPKTKRNVLTAYGLALEQAGVAHALDNMSTFMDDFYQETFADIIPDDRMFGYFCQLFDWSKPWS
ncbi:hypothetical protein GF324_07115, partial [bacterium]|nr:hypothetical protein [bacterium]